MTAPSLVDYHNSQYSKYSAVATEFEIPTHVDFFTPDNKDTGYDCTGIIVPNKFKGAKTNVYRSKIACIGIYHDQGRPSTESELFEFVTWTRYGKKIVLTHTLQKHKYVLNDSIICYNINVQRLECKITKILDEYSYEIESFLVGPSYGTEAAVQLKRFKSFYDENVVFRLLPSFKLITIAEVLEILGTSTTTVPIKDFYNVSSDQINKVPTIVTKSINYQKRVDQFGFSTSKFLYNQIFDDLGNPLRMQFKDNGLPEDVNNVDSKNKNSKIFINQPIQNSDRPFSDRNEIIQVYDFYGYLINDELRGPYYDNDLISRNSDNSILYSLTNTGKRKYDRKFLLDEFGNEVIGITDKNTTIVKKQTLPLALDRFNAPVKQPIKTI